MATNLMFCCRDQTFNVLNAKARRIRPSIASEVYVQAWWNRSVLHGTDCSRHPCMIHCLPGFQWNNATKAERSPTTVHQRQIRSQN
jgi:hypothetical protein